MTNTYLEKTRNILIKGIGNATREVYDFGKGLVYGGVFGAALTYCFPTWIRLNEEAPIKRLAVQERRPSSDSNVLGKIVGGVAGFGASNIGGIVLASKMFGIDLEYDMGYFTPGPLPLLLVPQFIGNAIDFSGEKVRSYVINRKISKIHQRVKERVAKRKQRLEDL